MNNGLICFILIIIYGNFDAVSKTLLTDRKNGLHVFNKIHLYCSEGYQNSSETEPNGHQLHFRIDEGFCGGAQELLICYPSQWSATNNRKVGKRLNLRTKDKYKKLKERCEQHRRKCTDNCGSSAKVAWHGISIRTKGVTDATATNLTLESSFLGRKFILGERSEETLTVDLAHAERDNDHQFADEFHEQIKEGAYLNEYKGLWLLGLDMLSQRHGQNQIELFVYRSCGCNMKAWFTNPTDPLHDISWGKLDHGSTECDKDAPKLKIKYPIEALRPFNEKSEIVIEGLVGAGNVTVSITKEWTQSAWARFIALIANDIIRNEKTKDVGKWSRLKNESSILQIVMGTSFTTLQTETHSARPKRTSFLRKGNKIKIQIYMKQFTYVVNITIQEKKLKKNSRFDNFKDEYQSPTWFQGLPYEHMDKIQILGDMTLLGQIRKKTHSKHDKMITLHPYYKKLDKAFRAGATFKVSGVLLSHATWFRIAFLHNARDRSLLVGESVFEICANLSTGKVALQSFPYDWTVYNSRLHNSDVPVVETTEFLSLEKGGGFEVFITFKEDKIETTLNNKKMTYVRNIFLQKSLPLWKITHFAVSGDVNIFEKKAPKCDIPDFNEPPRGSFSNFGTKLIETLMPDDEIQIRGKYSRMLESGKINITLLSETDDPDFMTNYKCEKKCPGFVVLQIKLLWDAVKRKANATMSSYNGESTELDIIDNAINAKEAEKAINSTSGGPFFMQIMTNYSEYNIKLNNRLIGKISVGAEKMALPAWLIEHIHIYGGLEIDEGYPKVNRKIQEKVSKRGEGFDLPYVRKLNAPLRVGDVIKIKTTVDRAQKYSKYEIGLYNRGWSYIRPFSRIQFNIRFAIDGEPTKYDMYSDFKKPVLNGLYRHWLKADWHNFTRKNDKGIIMDFEMHLEVASDLHYQIVVNSKRLQFVFALFESCEQCKGSNDSDLTDDENWSMPLWSADYIVLKDSSFRVMEASQVMVYQQQKDNV